MLCLNTLDQGKFKLKSTECSIHKFSMFNLFYSDNRGVEINMSEDYLYIFIENMLGRIKRIPQLRDPEMFGKLGEWQEYFYYDANYIKQSTDKIEKMKQAIFISTESYGVFLYNYNEKIWIELNKSYEEACDLTPIEYYSTPANYQILIAQIPQATICEWEKTLEEIKNMYQ